MRPMNRGVGAGILVDKGISNCLADIKMIRGAKRYRNRKSRLLWFCRKRADMGIGVEEDVEVSLVAGGWQLNPTFFLA
jgi:hypothetical protein